MYSDLEKYEKVNACESVKDLEQVILDFADENGMIQGRTRMFEAASMSRMVAPVVSKQAMPNYLTREFGIRQQALYLAYYEKM